MKKWHLMLAQIVVAISITIAYSLSFYFKWCGELDWKEFFYFLISLSILIFTVSIFLVNFLNNYISLVLKFEDEKTQLTCNHEKSEIHLKVFNEGFAFAKGCHIKIIFLTGIEINKVTSKNTQLDISTNKMEDRTFVKFTCDLQPYDNETINVELTPKGSGNKKILYQISCEKKSGFDGELDLNVIAKSLRK